MFAFKMKVIQTTALSKRYGRIQAVADLDLSIPAGSIYGLLGPNGSGKTTTLGMVLGIIRPSSGHFQWLEGRYGDNPRRRIGSLLETPNFYPFLSAWENLRIVAQLRRSPGDDFADVLRAVNLYERRHDAFRTYSLGMKQRLAIAATLIGDPEVLILDEPTNGLDPAGIAEVRDLIRELGRSGKTIIMASHILDEVERTCTHVAILRRGRLLADGEVGAIIHSDQIVEVDAEDRENLGRWIAGLEGLRTSEVDKDSGRRILYFPDPVSLTELNGRAAARGLTLSWLSQRRRSLETEFLELVSQADQQDASL